MEALSLATVHGILILDNDGKRIQCKYFSDTFPTLKEQLKFEETLFRKTHKANAEIIMHDGVTAVYRSNVDLFFYVLGAQGENELMLMGVLNGLYDTISYVLRRAVEKRSLLERMDAVLLVMDEIVDGGVIMETDPSVLMQRIAIKADDPEQSVKNMVQSAKENMRWTGLLKS
ncbi:Coatomer subunit zeta-1 [Geodia barretti]|uniref:Coatomer subunit zeta n=1 Tax=Geodia barretti TaxID=519541 RepID=A0AA35XJD5_GEOBA|nr:Coatomer subunit zeta-1 [Geodia barretti]